MSQRVCFIACLKTDFKLDQKEAPLRHNNGTIVATVSRLALTSQAFILYENNPCRVPLINTATCYYRHTTDTFNT